MSEQSKMKKARKDLLKNSVSQESKEQELNDKQVNIQAIQNIQNNFITSSEIADIARIDPELAREVFKEQKQINTEITKIMNRSLDIIEKDQKNASKENMLSNITMLLVVILFFVSVFVFAFFSGLDFIVAGTLGISVLPSIIQAFGDAVSKIIKAFKEPKNKNNR